MFVIGFLFFVISWLVSFIFVLGLLGVMMVIFFFGVYFCISFLNFVFVWWVKCFLFERILLILSEWLFSVDCKLDRLFDCCAHEFIDINVMNMMYVMEGLWCIGLKLNLLFILKWCYYILFGCGLCKVFYGEGCNCEGYFGIYYKRN